MDTSSPATPEAPPPPRRERLASIKALASAQDELVALAQLTIRVFDNDLSDTGWHTRTRCDAIGAFLRAARLARLEIIVRDTQYLEAHCARLLALRRHFGHAMHICKAGDAALAARDPIMLVDDRHYLHRFDMEQPRAILGIDDPEGAAPLIRRYEEIWATGTPAVPGTLLGL